MFSIIPLSFDAPSPRNPREYPHKSYIVRNESLDYIFVSGSIGLSSLKFSWWCPKDACFETECTMAFQGHPRSSILAPIESAYATSYWPSILTFGLIFPRLRDIAGFLLRRTTPPLFHPNIVGCSPWRLGLELPMLWLRRAKSQRP